MASCVACATVSRLLFDYCLHAPVVPPMSLASLPSYAEAPSIPLAEIDTPAYTAEPQPHEQRIGHNRVLRAKPSGEFVKQTKNGAVCLRLFSQQHNAKLPSYGLAGKVEGVVVISKPDGITSVDVKIEGILQLQEIAESGTAAKQLCLEKTVLWSKERNTAKTNSCPTYLFFKFILPTTYTDGDTIYPLPPSYEKHLSGVPGFRANIDYEIQVVIDSNKTNVVPNLVKSALFGAVNTVVSTPFIYYPHTCPAVPPPVSLRRSTTCPGFVESPEWKVFEDRIISKISDVQGGRDIISKLYLPASRVFCLRQPIPFRLTFISSAFSLAAFLPLLPRAKPLSPNRQHTKIELLRQSTVDVRNSLSMAAKTDIWRVDCIGWGAFKHVGDGPNWISFSGEIIIDDNVDLGGFRAGGLSVKDCIVLSIIPPDPVKSPFRELRQVVPVRLTTDPWTRSVGNYGFEEYSGPPSSDDYRT